MERLYIHETEYSPEIILDKWQGKFFIVGVSLMEHPFKFYEHVIEWINKYSLDPNDKTIFTFRILYLNSASLVNISLIFKALSKIYNKGHDVVVRWYYDERDPTIREYAEDLENLYKLPFEIVVIN